MGTRFIVRLVGPLVMWGATMTLGGTRGFAATPALPSALRITAASQRVFSLYQGEHLRLQVQVAAPGAQVLWQHQGERVCEATSCVLKTSAWGLGAHTLRLRLRKGAGGEEVRLKYQITVLPRPAQLALGEVIPELSPLAPDEEEVLSASSLVARCLQTGVAYAHTATGLVALSGEETEALPWAAIVASPPGLGVGWGRPGQEEYLLAAQSQAQLAEEGGVRGILLSKGALRVRNLNPSPLATTIFLPGAWLQVKLAAQSDVLIVREPDAYWRTLGKDEAFDQPSLPEHPDDGSPALDAEALAHRPTGDASAAPAAQRPQAMVISLRGQAEGLVFAGPRRLGAAWRLPAVAALRWHEAGLPASLRYEPLPTRLVTSIVSDTSPGYLLTLLAKRNDDDASQAPNKNRGKSSDSSRAQKATAPPAGRDQFGLPQAQTALTSWRDALKAAEGALAAQDYFAGLDALLPWEAQASDAARFNLALAKAYTGLALFDEALPLLEDLVDQGRDAVAQGEGAALQGLIHLQQGQHEAAQVALSLALAEDAKPQAPLYYYLGVAHYAQGHLFRAQRNFTYATWYEEARRRAASERFIAAIRAEEALTGRLRLGLWHDDNPLALATAGKGLDGSKLEKLSAWRVHSFWRYRQQSQRTAFYATVTANASLPQAVQAIVARREEYGLHLDLGLSLGGEEAALAPVELLIGPQLAKRRLGGRLVGDLFGHRWQARARQLWGQPTFTYVMTQANDTKPTLVKPLDFELWQPTTVSDRSFRKQQWGVSLSLPPLLGAGSSLDVSLNYTSLAYRYRLASADSFQGVAVNALYSRLIKQRLTTSAELSVDSKGFAARRDTSFTLGAQARYELVPGLALALGLQLVKRSSPLYPYTNTAYGVATEASF